MAKYPPTTGENWALNGQRYRIVGIDPQTKDVLVEKSILIIIHLLLSRLVKSYGRKENMF